MFVCVDVALIVILGVVCWFGWYMFVFGYVSVGWRLLCVCVCGVYNSGGVGGVFVCVVGEGGGLIVCQII